MDVAACIEEANFLDNLSPQQLAAPFKEDFQQFHSSNGLSIYATCSDSSRNTNNISLPSLGPEVPQSYYERPVQEMIPGAVSSSDLLSFYNSTSNGNNQQWDGCSSGSVQPKTAATDPINYAYQKVAPEADSTGLKSGSSPSTKRPLSEIEAKISDRSVFMIHQKINMEI